MTIPDRGDVIFVDFRPQRGREQSKRRPALVLSPTGFNEKFHVALVAPITSRAGRNAFEVDLPTGIGVQGSVLAHQIKALDWAARSASAAGRAPDDLVERVAHIVREIIS